jgi:hypothetical protein
MLLSGSTVNLDGTTTRATATSGRIIAVSRRLPTTSGHAEGRIRLENGGVMAILGRYGNFRGFG